MIFLGSAGGSAGLGSAQSTAELHPGWLHIKEEKPKCKGRGGGGATFNWLGSRIPGASAFPASTEGFKEGFFPAPSTEKERGGSNPGLVWPRQMACRIYSRFAHGLCFQGRRRGRRVGGIEKGALKTTCCFHMVAGETVLSPSRCRMSVVGTVSRQVSSSSSSFFFF